MSVLDPSRMMSVGDVSQLGGTQLVTLADGAERDVRVVEFRNTRGLEFDVLADRGFDIGWCRWKGRSLAWHSPTGFTGPWYREPEGFGFLRSFGGGLLTSSGLDHILYPEEDPEVTHNHPGRRSSVYGLHGRISNTPAEIVGHGIKGGDDGPTLFAAGRVVQAGAFAEHLVLERTYEVGLDGSTISWTDSVINEGWYPTPHMFLYHMNFGAPLLSPSTELVAPIEEVVFRTESAADDPDDVYLRFQAPQRGFIDQVFAHRMRPDAAGRVHVGLINHDDEENPWGVVVSYDYERFPHFFQWRYLDAGRYVTGLEPSTNGLTGRAEARESGELRMLEPGELVSSAASVEVIEGRPAVDDLRERIGGTK